MVCVVGRSHHVPMPCEFEYKKNNTKKNKLRMSVFFVTSEKYTRGLDQIQSNLIIFQKKNNVLLRYAFGVNCEPEQKQQYQNIPK